MSMPSQLGPVQTRILTFIREQSAVGRPVPTSNAIRHHFGMNSQSQVKDILVALVRRGFLEKHRIDDPNDRRRRFEYRIAKEARAQ